MADCVNAFTPNLQSIRSELFANYFALSGPKNETAYYLYEKALESLSAFEKSLKEFGAQLEELKVS